MKVFLGGTVAGSTWRDEMIPKLEVDYFNPVVEVWTEADQEREIYEREHCDFCLYVLSPKMIGWYSVAEVIDDSYKKPDHTIFCYLPEDGDKKFTQQQLKELEDISKIIAANGAIRKNTVEEVIDFLNSANEVLETIDFDETVINDVFISYGRRHSIGFATSLHDKLVAQNYKVWFDQNDIPLGVDFQQQIDDGIRRADNFIFVISPHSVKSIYCLKEIVLALKYNKRIIPILHVEPTDCWNEMHPEVEKLNWIYFREKENFDIPLSDWEKLDDFSKSFSGLFNLLEIQKTYIQQHTVILDKALRWERVQKKTSFLLINKEREIAEAWLTQKIFRNKRGLEIQAPTYPTNLHAKFICESKKYAENLLTDLFFSYDRANIEIKNEIQDALHLNYYTTWSDTIDIKSGQNFEKAIEKGIEETTSLLFLITKASLRSTYCINELEYAVKLKKRIISVLLEPVDDDSLPASLRRIEYIDFSDRRRKISVDVKSSKDVVAEVNARKEKAPFEKGIDAIMIVLNDQKEYFKQHKIYLVQALKWNNQVKNPSLLLRGYNLENAKAWLKIGLNKRNKPSKLHTEFITVSNNKSSTLGTEIFICYSRKDGDFAHKLNNDLQMSGKTTWFDQENIAASSDFQHEIYRGIETSNNFLFIISPNSIASPYCEGEVAHAKKHNKRVVNILLHETDIKTLPETLAKTQWIDFEKLDFHTSYSELLRTLDTDRDYVRKHTRYAQDAMQWEEHAKEEAGLLRGNELIIAEAWLNESRENNKQPAPTDLQSEYIESSKKAVLLTEKREKEQQDRLAKLEEQKIESVKKATNRRKIFLIVVTFSLFVSIAFGIYGARQRDKAHRTLEKLETEQYNKYFKIAENSFDKELYSKAIENYTEASKFKDEEILTENIKKCEKILEQKDEFDKYYDKGIKLYGEGNLIDGILELKKAVKLHYRTKYIRKTIKTLTEKAIYDCKRTATKMAEIGLYSERKYYKSQADSLEKLLEDF